MRSLVCTASIVVYNTPPDVLRRSIESCIASSLDVELHVTDNFQSQAYEASLNDLPIQYHSAGRNLGYGGGHNYAVKRCSASKYHIIMNPDVIFRTDILESLCSFMDKNENVGIVCPKILNENGTIQYLNKRYPTVFDLVARRFIPPSIRRFAQNRLDRYEMKDIGYEQICDVEFISGCFMFCRTDAFKAVGGFDERYFMYLEDADLSRKIQKAGFRTVYYPSTEITHLWERASYKSLRMTWIHIKSAIAYFNKWGWKMY